MKTAFTLVNPQNGHLAFRLFSFHDNNQFDHLQRLNYYNVLIIKEGNGKLKADYSAYPFSAPSLLCFSPYQPFLLETVSALNGIAINFHPDFFCIHKHHKEVACNGVLFNTLYNPPFHALQPDSLAQLLQLTEQIKIEMNDTAMAQYDMLVSLLKVFLITASRSKTASLPEEQLLLNTKEPPVLQELKNAVELHYRNKHAPNEYAELLHISPKALGKIVKTFFNKTLTQLIAERIIIEAKRELYLSSKPVKTIAWELGFDDEFYFSRFFKNNADVSPQLYRESIGFARAEAS